MPEPEPTNDDANQPIPQNSQTSSDQYAANPAGSDDPGASTPKKVLDDTHPATDTAVDPDELYEEGLPGAAEAAEPNMTDVARGYHASPDDPNSALGE